MIHAQAQNHISSIYNNGEILHTNRQTSETKRIFIPQNYISEIINKEPSIYTDNNEGIWVYTFQNSCLLYKKNQKSQWEKIELFPKNQIPFNRIHQILDILYVHQILRLIFFNYILGKR